jgi:ubiquinone biosynthesis protein COQ9
MRQGLVLRGRKYMLIRAMPDRIQSIRDSIIEKALPSVAFDGWTVNLLEQSAIDAGHEASMMRAVFPEGVVSALDHFADLMDRRMLEKLEDTDIADLRVRDRIRAAVLARLEALAPHREAERRAVVWRSLPLRAGRGGRILWRTADRIWNWAGDTATDYNRYTKRALLSGVLASTTLAWLDDEGSAPAFLERRIENVMQWGRILGKIKKTG